MERAQNLPLSSKVHFSPIVSSLSLAPSSIPSFFSFFSCLLLVLLYFRFLLFTWHYAFYAELLISECLSDSINFAQKARRNCKKYQCLIQVSFLFLLSTLSHFLANIVIERRGRFSNDPERRKLQTILSRRIEIRAKGFSVRNKDNVSFALVILR